jgi:hypothetical protein
MRWVQYRKNSPREKAAASVDELDTRTGGIGHTVHVIALAVGAAAKGRTIVLGSFSISMSYKYLVAFTCN